MRQGVWTFILLLLTAVLSVAAIPRADVPETSYNEVDTPVNQAPPVVLGVRFVRPAKTALVVPRKAVQASWNIGPSLKKQELASVPALHGSRSLHVLFCIFLI